MNTNGGLGSSRERLPTAVTIKERIVVLNVQSNRKSVSHGFLAGIFGTLDRFGVVVDLISTSEVYVSMAIEDVLDRKLQARLVHDLEKIGTVCSSISPHLYPVLPSPSPGFFFFHLGIRASRYGDPLDGRKADAQHGRHRGAHVRDARAGERQH
jgi:hypothetical protein